MTEGFYKGGAYASSADDTWTTPKAFYDKLHKEFNFTLDAAALASSALCEDWFGPDHPEESRRDALTQHWDTQGSVWLNPPYGRTIKDWVAKADSESKRGLTVVCLVPSRTDTNWWWDSCIHHEVRFIKGRLKFGNQSSSAPFPSAVIVMRRKDV
jgi:site-specific DNA-methyltransferase (adenine-specific)